MVLKARIVSQTGNGKKYSFHKIPLLIRTVLKLAAINGYDQEYRIRNQKGEYITNSNVQDLLEHCMSVGRQLTAEDEFVDLLAEAKIETDWIINENVKAKLAAKYGNRVKPAQYRPHPSQVKTIPQSLRTTARTFTELPPPTEIINVDPQEEDIVIDNEEPSDEDTHNVTTDEVTEMAADETPTTDDSDGAESGGTTVEEDTSDRDEYERLSKNRIRPKILVDRDKLERAKRLNKGKRELENLENWDKIDVDEPRQTRSSKRTKWQIPDPPDDDTGL